MPSLLNNLQQQESLTKSQLELIETVVEYGLSQYHKETAEVSIILVDDEYIRSLNAEYRGLNQPTDVLSFAIQEDQPGTPVLQINPENQFPELLGDIFISVQRAVEQAENYHHSLEREISYLAVHGLLHLLGFDHQSPDDTTRMRTAEEEILNHFQLNRI